MYPARRLRALKVRQINSAILKVPDGALIRSRERFTYMWKYNDLLLMGLLSYQ